MTYDLPGNVFTSRTLDHITRNRENYPALADSATFERVQLLEMGYRVHKIPYMKRESIGKKGVIELLKDNDILIIIDKSKDNDFLDAGFIRLVEGRPYLLHASEVSGKVGLDPEPLSDMMKLRAKRDCWIQGAETQGLIMVSVIVPVLSENISAAGCLYAAVDAVRNDGEVIVVDGGISGLGTALVGKMGESPDCLRSVRCTEDRRLWTLFRIGLDEAKGDKILFTSVHEVAGAWRR